MMADGENERKLAALNSYFFQVGESFEAMSDAVSIERLSIEFQPTEISVTTSDEERKTIPIERLNLENLRVRIEEYRACLATKRKLNDELVYLGVREKTAGISPENVKYLKQHA